MKFKQLKIENFMAVGKESLSLNGRGLILIQGENRDDTSQNSNGAGKSTIVDALCWVLYGQTAREESGDSIINRTAKKNCRVSITVEDDSDTYEIIRHRKYTKKKNVLEVLKNGSEDLTKGTDKLTQEVVNNVMGCSYDVFRSSVYAGQDAQIDLPNMTDKFLKQIVEEAAGIDRLQNAHEAAKAKLKDAKGAADVVERERFSEEMGISESAFHIDEAKDRIEKYEEQRKISIEKLEFRVANKKKKLGELVADLKVVDKKSIESEYEGLINRTADKEWLDKQSQLKQASETASEAFRKTSDKLDNLKIALQKAKTVITDSESLIGTACSGCGKPYTKEDLDDVVKAAKSELQSKLPEAKTLKAELEALSKSRSAALDAISNHERSLSLTDEEAERRDALKSLLDEYQSKLNDAQSIKVEITNDANEIDRVKNEVNPHIETLSKIEERTKEATENMNQLAEKLKTLEKNVSIAEGVVEVYSNTGVRAHILDTVTPYLNARTAEYLSQLSDGNLQAIWTTISTGPKGEVREKFHISVSSATGGEKYSLLSGGEKRKVRLATNMALQDLVSSRASKPLDLYIGDEIDHALDVAGLERLMTLLEEKAKTQGTVLVISHNELSDWIRDTLTIVKEGGYSRFETVGV